MSDLQQRALALHERGVIRLEHCHRCVVLGQPDGVFCGQCLTRGGILLACVEAGVGVDPQCVDGDGKVGPYPAQMLPPPFGLVPPKCSSWDAADAALEALEAAHG